MEEENLQIRVRKIENNNLQKKPSVLTPTLYIVIRLEGLFEAMVLCSVGPITIQGISSLLHVAFEVGLMSLMVTAHWLTLRRFYCSSVDKSNHNCARECSLMKDFSRAVVQW